MKTEEIEEIEREWEQEYSVYANDCLKIQTIEGELLPFKFNEIQIVLEDIISDIKQRGRLVRLMILKARREGVSTYIDGRVYWKTSTNFNRYAMIITHEPEATDFLFNMCKRFHAHNEWRPQDKYNNKKILEFNDETGSGLDSAIRVGTAGKEDFGSGQLVHCLHLSEVAKWPRHTTTDLLTSVLQCVPDELDTEIVFESTGKGIGGEFYTRFWACRYCYEIYLKDGNPDYKLKVNKSANPNNIYSSIFIPWFVFKKYEMEPTPDFKRTSEEEDLIKAYGLTDRHLQWRRWAIENKCGGSTETFKQEYPSNPREAFISTGRSYFDNVKVEVLMRSAPKPIARYEVLLGNGAFIVKPDGRFEVWVEPHPKRSYVISADVAEGLEKGDLDSVDVIDQLTGVQVAHWHGHIKPDLLAVLLAHIGKRYNTGWVVPERNNHGLLTVTRLVDDLRYPRVYAETVIEPPHQPRTRYGWVTTGQGDKSKYVIMDNLEAEIRSNTHGINCAETFEEMLSFKQNTDGTIEAEVGMFDDRVLSIAIGKYVRTRLPMTVEETKYEMPAQGASVPSALGWT